MFTKQSIFLRQRLKLVLERLSNPLWLMGEGSLYFFCTLATLLLGLSFGVFTGFLNNQKGIDQALCKLEAKSKTVFAKRKKKEIFQANFKGSNPDYLKDHLEALHFLDKDIEVLTRLEQEAKESFYKPIQERKAFLVSDQNLLSLVKLEERASFSYQEIEWGLEHPIQVSYADLQNILALVEIGKAKRPQLFFKKFSLSREGSNLFVIDFTIVQRNPHA